MTTVIMNVARNQQLTFGSAIAAFDKYGVEFNRQKYRALGITKDNTDLYTNLALILSDQCPHTIKVAVFGDDAKTIFKDSREFGGSVFSQLEDTFDYLRLCNRTSATFKELERIEKSPESVKHKIVQTSETCTIAMFCGTSSF